MSQIFISYRREDSAGYAGRLRESLERRLGKGAVFRDVDALEPGQDFVDTIGIRLRDADACLVLIGREWLDAEDASGRRRLEQQNDYVRLEIATALAQPHMRVVPVLVEGIRMPATEELPETIQGLARRQAVSLRDESWDEDVKRFVTALDRRSWLERHRLKLAASAVLLVSALGFAQFFRSQVSPDTETTTTVTPVESVPAPAAPATSPSTTTGRDPADALLRREGPLDQDVPTGASRNVVVRGGPASSPTAPLAGRTAQPPRTSSGRTGSASTPPSTPDVASTARPNVADGAPVAPLRPALSNDGDVAVRPPATSRSAPPAAAPPAVVIPPKPAITSAALVRQAIAVYERAAEALEYEGVKRIWPAAPDALRNSYRNLRSQSVDFDCAEPAISGDTATISCKEQIRSVGAGGITLPVATNTATFSMRRNGDAWEISGITRRPR